MITNIIIRNELLKPDELLAAISNFCCTTGYCYPHYLVINRETYAFLIKYAKDYTLFRCYCTDINERKINDINVAFCDSLKFGEIDIV